MCDYFFLIVVRTQLSPFSSHHFPLPPTLNLIPFGFVRVSFIQVPWWPFPYFPPCYPLPPPLWLLSVYSLFQCLWLYFAYLFCWLGSTYRWDPTSKWRHQKTVAHLHHGILCSRKNEGAPTLRDSMGGSGEHRAKWDKPGGDRLRF